METATANVVSGGYIELLEKQRKKALELRSLPIRTRKEKLRKIRDWVLKHRKEIQIALYEDYRKPAEETDLSECYVVISEVRHALRNLSKWTRKEKVDTPLAMLGTRSYIKYEPKGTCLIIAPWNYPFNLVIAPLVSAIAAGNTAVLKPSEFTPHTAALISRMISELFDPSEVAVVEGGPEVSSALLELKFDHIFFTGSPRVGKIVMEAAAKNLASVTLELGGKSPAIVDETASIKDTAEKLVAGKFVNNGQTCIAPDYVLVHEKVEKSLLKALTKQIQKNYNPEGKGIDQTKDYGRLVSSGHLTKMNELLEDAVTQGATIETGGKISKESKFLEPTILSNIPTKAKLLTQEIFGPILPVIPYSNLDRALERINQGEKPLALYIFSRKKSHQEKVLNECSSGTACVNECVIHFLNHYLPFGGVNNSGIGKSHGQHGFKSFSNEKGVLKQRVGFTTAKLLVTPYNGFSRFVINTLLKYL